MKIKLSLGLVLLTGIVLTYSGCKKSNNNPSGPALTPKQVSSQIALNLTQTLYSGFGAFSLGDGLNAPDNLGVVHTKNGLKVNSAGDPLCGLTVDTTLNYSVSENGTSASVKGTLGFKFTCSNGVISGFNVFDDLAVTESTSEFSGSFKVNENLTLLSLDPSNDNSNLSLNGTFGFDGSYKYKSGAATQTFNYTLTSILLDANGQILSGNATFSTKGSGTPGVWDFSGTIKFLGNGNATITISGTAYNVNLQTGVVS